MTTKDIENQLELVIKENTNQNQKTISDKDLIKKINDVKEISDKLIKKIEEIEKKINNTHSSNNTKKNTLYETIFYLFKLVVFIIVLVIAIILFKNHNKGY